MLRRAASLSVIALAMVLAAIALTSAARAQTYPPPVGSLTVTSESTTAPTRASIELTATVRDNQGNPAANQDVTFTIVSQPGNDASLGSLSRTVTSDQNGVARVALFTGSVPGRIIVDVVTGDKTSQLTVQVQTGALPATGSPPPERQDGGGLAPWLVAFIVAGALALLGGLSALARRRA